MERNPIFDGEWNTLGDIMIIKNKFEKKIKNNIIDLLTKYDASILSFVYSNKYFGNCLLTFADKKGYIHEIVLDRGCVWDGNVCKIGKDETTPNGSFDGHDKLLYVLEKILNCSK